MRVLRSAITMAVLAAVVVAANASAASGRLDRSFGEDGRATAFFRGWTIGMHIADLAPAPGGKTLVASEMLERGDSLDIDPGIARFNRDGSPDRSFSRNGQMIFHTPGLFDEEINVAAQANGKVLVMNEDGKGGPTLFRLLADGRVDRSFGAGGALHPPMEAVAELTVLADGRILITGSQANQEDAGRWDFRATVLHASGRIDSSFGEGGVADVDFAGASADASPTSDFASSSAVMRDGRILLAGSTHKPSPYATSETIAIARLLPNGQPDRSFGTDGLYLASPASGAASGLSRANAGVAATSDGGVVFGGASGGSFLLSRVTASGTSNTAFGEDGVARLRFGQGKITNDADALAVDRRGSVYLAGSIGGRKTRDFAVLKVSGNGRPDPVFGGGDGLAVTDFEGEYDDADGIAVLRNDKIVVSGTIGHYRIGLIRLLP